MTSLLMPVPTGRPHPTSRTPSAGDTRTPASGLPVARGADPDDGGFPLAVETLVSGDRGDTALVRAHGEIDLLTVPHLRGALDTWIAAGVSTLVADLEGVSFVDCTGIGMLADARRRARCHGVRLEIVPGRAVARVAALLDLTETLGLGVPE